MKISFDLRFAHLSGGGGEYARQLMRELIGRHPETGWRIYYNDWCPRQKEILRQIKETLPPVNEGNLQLQQVRTRSLSLGQHVEFLRFRDESSLYHYPHFDLPFGMRHKQLVLTIHDLYPLTVANYCSGIKRAYFRLLAGRNARRATKVITISQYSKKDIINLLGISEEKIAVIYQGYDSSFRPITDKSILDIINLKYRLPEKFIFYTGNHKPHKNLKRLIEAYGRLAGGQREEFPLVLTGEISREAGALIAQAKGLGIDGQVRFAGWVEQRDLPGLYNLASLVVHPSLYEGFGLAALEAMACGTPVVCSNATAIPEVVGEAARVFDPYQVDEITEAIKAALEHDIGNAAVKQACLSRARLFTWEKTAAQTYEVYQSVAK